MKRKRNEDTEFEEDDSEADDSHVRKERHDFTEMTDEDDRCARLPAKFFRKLRGVTEHSRSLLRKALNANDRNILSSIPTKQRVICMDAFSEAQDALQKSQLTHIKVRVGGTVRPMPPDESFRMSVFGPSGAGKSTLVGHYLENYRRLWPDNDVFVISPYRDPKAYGHIDPDYIRMDHSLVDKPLDLLEFKHCCIVFDDIESLPGGLDVVIDRFRNQCLEAGRKHGIATICVSHLILNRDQTKKMLNESDQVVVFPKSNFSQIKAVMDRYYGFSPEQIEYVRGIPSRWALIKRSYPPCVVSEHEIKML